MKKQTILAGAGIMAIAALLSRVLGWVRDHEIGRYWGNTSHTDAYWAAFMVPDLLYYLLAGGALGAAIIPTFSAYLRRREEKESWEAANTLVTLLGLLALGGIVLIIIFAPVLVTLAAAGFRKDVGKATESAMYVRLLAPMVFFTVLSALFTGILQAHRHFTAPAFAWLVYNFGIIAGAVVGGRYFIQRGDVAGLQVLADGRGGGAALLVLVQIPALVARGFRYRPSLDLSHPGVREVLRLFLPYMAGLAFTQICLLWLPSFFGSYFPNGVTSLRYANRLVVLPLGVFGIAISTATFPAMAERIDAGEVEGFRKLFSGSLRAIFFLSVPSRGPAGGARRPGAAACCGRAGGSTRTAVSAATFCLVYYAVALIGLGGLQVDQPRLLLPEGYRHPARRRDQLHALHRRAGLRPEALQPAVCLHRRGHLRGCHGGYDRHVRVAASPPEGHRRPRDHPLLPAGAAGLGRARRGGAGLLRTVLGQKLHVPTTHFTTTAPRIEAANGGTSASPAADDPAAPAAQPSAQSFSLPRVAVQVALSMLAGLLAYLAVLRLLGAPEIESFLQALRQRRRRRHARGGNRYRIGMPLSEQQRTRNFCIIAHIDHGKSTLADRMLQVAHAVDERKMREQVLDSMDLERERGITIKASAIRLVYRARDGEEYILNLIDTPGHVDFTYEVSRSLAAAEGAVLVVDAVQGVEAQTVANVHLATEQNLEIVPVINKIDLPNASPERTMLEIDEIIGLPGEDSILTSAKQGIGIEDVMEAVIRKVPPPSGDPEAPLQALIFDSHFDPHRGIVCLRPGAQRAASGTAWKSR